MYKPFHITLVATALLLAGCAPARHVTEVLTHGVLVHQKRDDCMELPHIEKTQCLDRVDASYRNSHKHAEELRRQREREGEELPDLQSRDRM